MQPVQRMQPIRLPVLLAVAAVAVMAAPATSNAQGLRAPSQVYWSCLGDYHDGAFRTAVADFLGEAQSGSIKAGSVRWLDSVCYHTMAGESYFQLGNYGEGIDQYTIALNLFIQHSDWMIRVQFEPNLMPAVAGNAVGRVPWGQSKRQFQLGVYKEYTLSSQGSLNQMTVLQRGGVIQMPMLVPLSTQEVVRCTCQAMRRRRDILGPICAFDPLTSQLLEVCSRRAGQPNHWSECYVDMQLGMAFSAAGKDAQAKTALERSLVAGGMYDHPLTAMAMVELARIALIQGDYVTAERWYEEATYTAVNFDDWTVLEDAFRYGTMTHLMANRKGMYPLLLPAAEWAQRQGLGYLQVSLLELCAESAATVGQAKVADNYIRQARTTIGRSDIAVSRLGAGELHRRTRIVRRGPGRGRRRLADDCDELPARWRFAVAVSNLVRRHAAEKPNLGFGSRGDGPLHAAAARSDAGRLAHRADRGAERDGHPAHAELRVVVRRCHWSSRVRACGSRFPTLRSGIAF